MAVAAAILVGLAVVSLPGSNGRVPAQLTPPNQGVASGLSVPWMLSAEADVRRKDSRTQRVRALLEQRAQAVRRHDKTAFLATVDPKAPQEFLDLQRAMFDNLTEVPFSQWGYTVDGTQPARQPAGLPVPADEVWAPQVTLNYALSHVDTVTTGRPMGFVFARRGDSWYLTDDESFRAPDLVTPGRETWRGPWDFAPCRVRTTSAGMVISHDGHRELANRVAGMLDQVIGGVTDVWGRGWSQRVAVLIPDSPDELRSLVGSQFAVDGIAAVAVADRVDPVAHRVEGPRVVLNPRTAQRLSDVALRVVLQHEVTHVAARADTVDGAPMWLLEGFADYVGYRKSGIAAAQIAPDLATELRRGPPPEGLPADAEFHLPGPRLDIAYQQSWSVVRYLAERAGERRVVDLYRRIAGSGTNASVDPALREVAGLDTAGLIAGWRADLRRTFG